MKESIRYVGLDVHGETISVAVAEKDGEVVSLGKLPNAPKYVAKLVKKLAAVRFGRVTRPDPADTCCTGSSPSSAWSVMWWHRRWCP